MSTTAWQGATHRQTTTSAAIATHSFTGTSLLPRDEVSVSTSRSRDGLET